MWFVTDDAYISFRYARHLADGHGLRFNLGPEAPVEGYSNFLWVVLAAGARRLGLDMVVWMPRLSCACGLALVVWLHAVLRRRFVCATGTAALATAAVAWFPPFAAWSSSGLETVPFALALFATFERMVLRREGPDARGGSIAGSALLLLRVDGFAWCALAGLLSALAGRRARTAWRGPLLRFGAVLGLLLAAFLVHRRLYFERWISNTTQAKVLLDLEQLRAGRDYLLFFAFTFLAPFSVAVTAAWTLARARSDLAALPLVAMSLAVPAFALVVGGDFMCMGRLLVPGFALQALMLGALLRDASAGGARGRAACAVAGAGLVALGLLPIASRLPGGGGRDLHLVPAAWLARFHFRLNTPEILTESEMWESQKLHAEDLARQGRAFALVARPGDSLVQGAIGAIGYHSELFLHDTYGLVTREVAELPADDYRKRSPGHDRVVQPEFFLDRRPTFLDHRLVNRGNRRQIVRIAAQWRERPGAAVYAPELLELPAESELAGEALLVFRRVEEDQDAAEAWRGFEREYPELRDDDASK